MKGNPSELYHKFYVPELNVNKRTAKKGITKKNNTRKVSKNTKWFSHQFVRGKLTKSEKLVQPVAHTISVENNGDRSQSQFPNDQSCNINNEAFTLCQSTCNDNNVNENRTSVQLKKIGKIEEQLSKMDISFIVNKTWSYFKFGQ